MLSFLSVYLYLSVQIPQEYSMKNESAYISVHFLRAVPIPSLPVLINRACKLSLYTQGKVIMSVETLVRERTTKKEAC